MGMERLNGLGEIGLKPGQALRVNRLPLDHGPVPAEQAAVGTPTVGWMTLTELDGFEVGVWELTEGTMYDVEIDEVFVVTAGRATVVIEPAGGHPVRRAELAPGTVMRLAAGMRTVWTVTEPLRKVYLTRAAR
ncbi:cupin domain-containing protein [Arthrobacter ginkgonis]|uniref:Cupin domain-containing protein n=2 Tax=Arthrobacter ginkgonis TaxID=1630594 RepID=A0ABP7CHZ6_9MICC